MQKYPCIGQWQFLLTPTPDLPFYTELLERLKAGASILDLGCCFGQDLRYMAADGAPTQNMYASDIVPEFWDISFDLYRDNGRFNAQFLKADILDAESPHKELNTKLDIILVNQVFHLFDWERQVQAGKNIVTMSRPGAWVVGYHIGSVIGRAVPVKTTTGGVAGTAGSDTKFIHNPDTWREMWRTIGEETGTQWIAESWLRDLKDWGLESEDSGWMGAAARAFEFIVRRVDGEVARVSNM